MARPATGYNCEPRRAAARASEPVYAALDLGTNNCRLLVARPARQGFRVIDAFSRIVRLGEGLNESGFLSKEAQARALGALHVCAGKVRRRRVTHLRAVATEACRRAGNCDAFLERVRRETGITLEIISNDEEASLAFRGCVPLLDPEIAHALVFDIGGGSTELAFMNLKPVGNGAAGAAPPETAPTETGDLRGAGGLRGWHSISIGVVTLAERHGGAYIAAEAYEAMVREVRAALDPFEAREDIRRLAARGDLQMLGTSGTVTTLAGVHQCLKRYDRARVDGSYLDFETVQRLSREIAAMSYEARRAHPCIGRERADLVVAGCAILEAVCRMWPVGRLRVADRGLREGMLYTMMAAVQGAQGAQGTSGHAGVRRASG